MCKLNIHAPIISGVSAAGFKIGDNLDNIRNVLDIKANIDLHQPINLNKILADSNGWIATQGGIYNYDVSLHYKNRCVRLDFNKEELLYAIYVFSGYQGQLFNKIKVGSMLSEVSDILNLEYDDGDEMHYPDENSGTRGIGFCAAEVPLEEDPTQVVTGFCIHNWIMGS